MPDNFRIGATSSTGIQINQATIYKAPARGFRAATDRDVVLTNMVGGPPVLSRFQSNSRTWDWLVYARRGGSYQTRLNDFAAIQTQITNAVNYSLGDSATPIYLFEQYSDQTTAAQYLVIHGYFDEEARDAGSLPLYITGHLHLVTRIAGA